MENKLLSLLSQLSANQKKRLRDFVFSPYFNKNEKLSLLITQALAYPEASEEQLFEAVYPSDNFDKTKLSRLRYKAFNLLEQFWLQEAAAGGEIESLFVLLAAYTDGKSDKLAAEVVQRLEILLDSQTAKDSHHYYNRFRLVEGMMRLRTKSHSRKSDMDYQTLEENLNLFFIARKLELACNALAAGTVIHSDFQPKLLSEILLFLSQNPSYLQYPAIKLYYNLYNMLTQPDERAYFYEYQRILAESEQQFSVKELKNLFAYSRNYCITRINQGHQEFETQLFNMYDHQLQKGWILDDNGQLSAANYKNIAVLALRLDETEWTLDFLKQFRHLLPENEQEDTYRYCIAKWHFVQKEYHETLKLLHAVDFADVFLNIAARKLLLQTYYASAEWEGLQSALNAFRVYLHRDKTLSEQHKLMNRNFANLLAKIANRELKSPKEKWVELVQKTKPLSEKKWLLEILEAAE